MSILNVFVILHSFVLEVSHRSESRLIWIASRYKYNTAQGHKMFCFNSRCSYHNAQNHRLFLPWVYFNIHRQKLFSNKHWYCVIQSFVTCQLLIQGTIFLSKRISFQFTFNKKEGDKILLGWRNSDSTWNYLCN